MACHPALLAFGTTVLTFGFVGQPSVTPNLAAGAQPSPPSWREPLQVRETVLARFDAQADRDTLVVDRGAARRVLWVSGRKDARRVIVDGTPEPEFREVRFGGSSWNPVISPDGSRVAYHAKRKKWFVVVDGQEYGPYDGGDWRPPIVFSADSRRVAWGAQRNGKVVQVVDGVEHGPYEIQYEFLLLSSPTFSPDSRRVAFRASMREGKHTVGRIIVDGVPGPPHRWVGRPRFGPDGQHVAYWARERDGHGLQLMVNGRSVATSPSDSAETLERLDEALARDELPFAPDADRLAYIIERNRKFVPVIHGKEGPQTSWIGPIVFSPDFARCAYGIASEKGASRVLGALTMLAGASRAHTVMLNTRLVVDGVVRQEYPPPVSNPLFSPDGSRLAYMSKHAVVVNGVAGPRYEEVWPVSLAFSSDGRRMAYAAKTEVGWHVVADGAAGPAFKELRALVAEGGRSALTFTPDGEHVVYRVNDGGQKVVVGNLGATPTYAEVLDVVVFNRPGTLAFAAVRGEELLRVEVDVPPAAQRVHARQ